MVATVKTLTEEIGLNDTPTSETQYKKLKSTDSYVNLGTTDSELHEYYVVEGDELNIYALTIVGPNVHIILRDSACLHLEKDIGVEKGNTVYFHAQSTASYIGKLTAGGGIGGEIDDDGANIEIHGGNFDLQGTENCAAIGGQYETNGTITIYDGRIKAIGGDSGAGIGSGYGCSNYGNIFIYGGRIEATGSAGIGGGTGCLNGNLTIWDGAITANGQNEAAGIGCDQYAYDYGAGTITINGGTVIAKAGRDETDCRAIGPGCGEDDDYGKLTIGDEMMVSSERMANAGERKNMCWYRTQVQVEPCTHKDHQYTISGTGPDDTHTQQRNYCTTPFQPEKHTFVDRVCIVCGAEEMTGVDAVLVNSESVNSEKFANDYHDLQGRKLNGRPTQAGMYIHNGKKVAITK